MDIAKVILLFVKERISLRLVLAIFLGLVVTALLVEYEWLFFIPPNLRVQGEAFIWLVISLILYLIVSFFWDYCIMDFFVFLRNTWISSETDRTFTSKFSKVQDFDNDWKIHGYSNVFREGLVVTNSDSGILLNSNFLSRQNKWKNFVAIIKVVFGPEKGTDTTHVSDKNGVVKKWKTVNSPFRKILGVIFRAQSFEDYFMVEIWIIGKKVLLKPHVRVGGNWDVPVYNSRNFTSFLKNSRRKDNQFELKIELRDNNLELSSDDITEKIKWTLPTHYQINLGYLPEEDKKKNSFVRKISFRDKAGQFGFRNFGNELAIVKYLKIEPLSKNN